MSLLSIILITLLVVWLAYVVAGPAEEVTVVEFIDDDELIDLLLAAEVVHFIESDE